MGIPGGRSMFSKARGINIAVGVIVIGGALSALSVIKSRAQLQVQNAELQRQAALKNLPIGVGFRKAILGHGEVAVLRNLSGAGLAVKARIVDAATHQEHNFTIDIDPGRPTEFGYAQGYAFEPGDAVTLSHDGYKTVYWQVP
jgi:hypothetical protein